MESIGANWAQIGAKTSPKSPKHQNSTLFRADQLKACFDKPAGPPWTDPRLTPAPTRSMPPYLPVHGWDRGPQPFPASAGAPHRRASSPAATRSRDTPPVRPRSAGKSPDAAPLVSGSQRPPEPSPHRRTPGRLRLVPVATPATPAVSPSPPSRLSTVKPCRIAPLLHPLQPIRAVPDFPIHLHGVRSASRCPRRPPRRSPAVARRPPRPDPPSVPSRAPPRSKPPWTALFLHGFTTVDDSSALISCSHTRSGSHRICTPNHHGVSFPSSFTPSHQGGSDTKCWSTILLRGKPRDPLDAAMT